MTVKELKKVLDRYQDEQEIIIYDTINTVTLNIKEVECDIDTGKVYINTKYIDDCEYIRRMHNLDIECCEDCHIEDNFQTINLEKEVCCGIYKYHHNLFTIDHRKS